MNQTPDILDRLKSEPDNDWMQEAAAEIELLRHALILLSPVDSQKRAGGGLCWCRPDYDVAKYGHSVACGVARAALGRAETELTHWEVTVHSWGTTYLTGTEDRVEEWRRHKANWEQSGAVKRRLTDEEVAALKAAGTVFDDVEGFL